MNSIVSPWFRPLKQVESPGNADLRRHTVTSRRHAKAKRKHHPAPTEQIKGAEEWMYLILTVGVVNIEMYTRGGAECLEMYSDDETSTDDLWAWQHFMNSSGGV